MNETTESPEASIPVFTLNLTVRDPDNKVVGCEINIKADNLLSMDVDPRHIFEQAINAMKEKLFNEGIFKPDTPIESGPTLNNAPHSLNPNL